MPLYDYKCTQCGSVREVRHGFEESYEDACPACGGAMARVFNAAPIVFKGSGFYATDSRPKGDAKTESTSDAKSETKPDSKTETKTETKSDSASAGKSESAA